MSKKSSKVKAEKNENEKKDEENDEEEKKEKPKWTEKFNVKLSKKSKAKVAKYTTIGPVLLSFVFIYVLFKLEQPYALSKVCVVL